jgi:tRNA pseudouridine32 synthase/23S rRNA pseudouridine746 synthase/23S rRNA pseudouridine1911/1915/1917 synthase
MVAWNDWNELRRHCVVHEDDDVLVVDKPVGLSVMGERHGDDLVTLAARAGEELHPAHRIDKVTSGVCLLAKSLDRHGDLTRQFAKRTTAKEYLAVVVGGDLPEEALVDLPLVTASSGRVRVAADRRAIGFDPATATYRVPDDALRPGPSYPSRTRFRRLGGDGDLTAVVAEPITGRRHQIRVHLAWIGFPIAGDPLFRSTSRAAELSRTHLHAHRLTIRVPSGGDEPVTFTAPPDGALLAPAGVDPSTI